MEAGRGPEDELPPPKEPKLRDWGRANGRDLTGWKMDKPNTEKPRKVVDGTLVSPGPWSGTLTVAGLPCKIRGDSRKGEIHAEVPSRRWFGPVAGLFEFRAATLQ